MAVFRFPGIKFYNWIRRIPNSLWNDLFLIIMVIIIFVIFIIFFVFLLEVITEATRGLTSFQKIF